MYNLEFLELAKSDIQNIAYYITAFLKNPSAALKVVKKIIEETNNINRMIFPKGIKYKIKNVPDFPISCNLLTETEILGIINIAIITK